MRVAIRARRAAIERFKAREARLDAIAASIGIMRRAAAQGVFAVTKSWIFGEEVEDIDAPQTAG